MSGAVCQRRAPDSTGQGADKGGGNPWGEGYGEVKAAVWASKGRETTDATDTNDKENGKGGRNQTTS